MGKYVLIVKYSFDADEPVYLFDTLEQARAEMKKQVLDEVRVAEKEDGKTRGNEFNYKIDEDAARYINYFFDENDVTTWKILPVREL